MAALILSYLVGSIPTSIIAGRLLKGIDIREHGSGNAGATNAFRVLGWKPGLAVALFDMGKGIFTILVISRIEFLPEWLGTYDGPAVLVPILCCCLAIIGHMFPVFAGFRGGKGVAAGAGAFFALHPVTAAICLAVFTMVLVASGYVSLSSIFAAVTLPLSYVLLILITRGQFDTVWIVFTSLVAALIILMHRRNISRLLAGTENRFEKVRIFARGKGGG